MRRAALAGLDVVRIINEPTAAALVYEPHSSHNERLLVYDLGRRYVRCVGRADRVGCYRGVGQPW